MILPNFLDLIPEQLAVYEQPANASILVVGPPGSGKTSMAIWRARYIAEATPNATVVLVTRNRLLATVAGKLAAEQGGGAVSTMTMNTFITSDYWRRFNVYAPQFSPFNYDWGKILDDYAQSAIEPAIDHLIVDEGQNLPAEFFYWAVQFGAKRLSVFADEDQATLGEGTKIAQFQGAGFVTVLPLVHNHRNTQAIADVMETFHVDRVLPPATVSRKDQHDHPRLFSTASWNKFADTVVARYRNRAEAIGVIVHKQNEVNHLTGLLRARMGTARVDSYTSDMEAGMEAQLRIGDNGITVLSGESAIGLEFETVYLQDLTRSLPREHGIQNRRLYMLCARARNNLILVNGPVPLLPVQLTALPNPPILDR